MNKGVNNCTKRNEDGRIKDKTFKNNEIINAPQKYIT